MDKQQATRSLGVLAAHRRGTDSLPMDPGRAHAGADEIILSYLRFHEPDLEEAYRAVQEAVGSWWFE